VSADEGCPFREVSLYMTAEAAATLNEGLARLSSDTYSRERIRFAASGAITKLCCVRVHTGTLEVRFTATRTRGNAVTHVVSGSQLKPVLPLTFPRGQVRKCLATKEEFETKSQISISVSALV
jgi:hypothetical protein